MPASLASADLKNLVPTKEEIAEARKILATGNKATRSRMQSMRQWMEKNPDSEVSDSKGQDRRGYLEAFIVHQLRQKDASKRAEHIQSASHQDAREKKFEWLSMKQMIDRHGEVKAKGWMNSAKINKRADPITGSQEIDSAEWECPRDSSTIRDMELNEFGVKSSGEANEADIKLLQDMSFASNPGHGDQFAGGSSSGQQVGDAAEPLVHVKQEVMTAKELEEKAYQMFLTSVVDRLREFQDMQVSNAALLFGLKGQPFSEALQSAVNTHGNRIQSLVKMLLRAQTDKVAKGAWQKLDSAMRQVRAMQETMEAHARKFGVSLPAKKKQPKRLRTE